MKTILVGVLTVTLCLTGPSATYAQATSNCAGYYSNSNPYPCCTNGNCTWWAWKMANENWGQQLGVRGNNWGNASSWLSRARSNHFGVRTVPAPGTVAVNSYTSGYGHVAWVYAVDSVNVYVTEMNCNTTSGMRYWQYPITWFDGFIYKKPRVASMYPQPNWSTQDRTYTLYGNGFQTRATVRVTFPNGSSGTLSGTQIPYTNSESMSIVVTFGTVGWYSLQVRNRDGGWSDPWWVYVM